MIGFLFWIMQCPTPLHQPCGEHPTRSMPLTVAQFVSGFATSSSGGARANRRGRATVEKRPNYSLAMQQIRSRRNCGGLTGGGSSSKSIVVVASRAQLQHGRSVDGLKGFARAQTFG